MGRPHGRDGAFYVDGSEHRLGVGTRVTVAGRVLAVERRAGTAARPIVRLAGVHDRPQAVELRGAALLVPEAEAPLGEGEWLADDLVGCRIEGLGEVRRVLAAPSCDLLEVGDEGLLVPLVADAVTRVDVERRVIEVDRRFLALDEDGATAATAGPGRGGGGAP